MKMFLILISLLVLVPTVTSQGGLTDVFGFGTGMGGIADLFRIMLGGFNGPPSQGNDPIMAGGGGFGGGLQTVTIEPSTQNARMHGQTHQAQSHTNEMQGQKYQAKPYTNQMKGQMYQTQPTTKPKPVITEGIQVPQSTPSPVKTVTRQGGGSIAADRLRRIQGRIDSITDQLRLAKQNNNMAQVQDLQVQLDALVGVKIILTGGSAPSNKMETTPSPQAPKQPQLKRSNKYAQSMKGPNVINNVQETTVGDGQWAQSRKHTAPRSGKSVATNANPYTPADTINQYDQYGGTMNQGSQVGARSGISGPQNHQNLPAKINVQPYQDMAPTVDPYAPAHDQGINQQTAPYDQGMNQQAHPYDQQGPPYNQQRNRQAAQYDQGMNQQAHPYDQQRNQQAAPYDQGIYQQGPLYNQQRNEQVAPYNQGINQQAPAYDQGINQWLAQYTQGMNQQAPAYDQSMNQQVAPYDQGMNQQAPVYGQGMNQQAAPYNQGMNQQVPQYNQGMNQQAQPYFDQGMPQHGFQYDLGMGLGINQPWGAADWNIGLLSGPTATTVAPVLGDVRMIGNERHIFYDADGFDTFQWVKESEIPPGQLDHLTPAPVTGTNNQQAQQHAAGA